jgi:hypothetical protein
MNTSYIRENRQAAAKVFKDLSRPILGEFKVFLRWELTRRSPF